MGPITWVIINKSVLLQKLFPFVSDLHEASSLLMRAINKLEDPQRTDSVQVIHFMSFMDDRSSLVIHQHLCLCRAVVYKPGNRGTPFFTNVFFFSTDGAAEHDGAEDTDAGRAGGQPIGRPAERRRGRPGSAEEGK